MEASAYIRLSGFYFFYFASLGAFLPYWGLYLKDLGYSPERIGSVMALIMATKIVAPNVWGPIADHTGRRIDLIRIASLLSVAAFGVLLFRTDPLSMYLALTAYAFFWNASLPQFEAITLNHLRSDAHRYSRIRLWGSVGFIVAVLLMPILLKVEDLGLSVLPAVVFFLLVAIWLTTLVVSEYATQRDTRDAGEFLDVLRQPRTVAFLVACLLAQASHGPYYTFFSIYLADHGYSKETIGILWALGVAAEVGVFFSVHRWLVRFGAANILLVALALTVLRWVMIATLVDSILFLVLAQTLHAASFGLLHAAAIHLVHSLFPGKTQGRGQALYSSVSFGAGGAIGSLASGIAWAHWEPVWVFLLAAGVALLGLFVALRGFAAVGPREPAA
ncbi:MAG: MFS transporter [Gammaproteobacteria bacterium]|nr:MFS transporter [Gammaproteobacteria bacterium]